jgi:hypothetical protein
MSSTFRASKGRLLRRRRRGRHHIAARAIRHAHYDRDLQQVVTAVPGFGHRWIVTPGHATSSATAYEPVRPV